MVNFCYCSRIRSLGAENVGSVFETHALNQMSLSLDQIPAMNKNRLSAASYNNTNK